MRLKSLSVATLMILEVKVLPLPAVEHVNVVHHSAFSRLGEAL